MNENEKTGAKLNACILRLTAAMAAKQTEQTSKHHAADAERNQPDRADAPDWMVQLLPPFIAGTEMLNTSGRMPGPPPHSPGQEPAGTHPPTQSLMLKRMPPPLIHTSESKVLSPAFAMPVCGSNGTD